MNLAAEFKNILPPAARKVARKTVNKCSKYSNVINKQVRRYTGVLPDFIIIGAQKCGTTSLYDYLTQHPCIYRAATKEVGYFDRYYSDDLNWYRAHFPSSVQKYYIQNVLKRPFLTGEASTGYILNPHALRRIAKVIPRTKLILLLRNPVTRAYSHYQHTLREGNETLAFEEAIEQESARIGPVWKRMLADEKFYSLQIALHGYLMTGIYVTQIKALMSLFPREQILIIESSDLSKNPNSVLSHVLNFLEIPPWIFRDFERHNSGSYTKMNATTRKKLLEYYRPHNQSLYELLGRTFEWDK